MKKILIIAALSFFAVIQLAGCAKKDPCLEKWGVKDCHELFDLYQKNLPNPAKAQIIKDCMDKACK